jgi:hypothetical protein
MISSHRAARVTHLKHVVLTSCRATPPSSPQAASTAGSRSHAAVQCSHRICSAQRIIPLSDSRRGLQYSERPLFAGKCTLQRSARKTPRQDPHASETGACAYWCLHHPPRPTRCRIVVHRGGTPLGLQGHSSPCRVGPFTSSCRTEGPQKNRCLIALSPTRAGGPEQESELGYIY